MPGKRSVALRRAIRNDVDSWTNYAFYSGDHANPFEVGDKRRSMFDKQLHRSLLIDAEFREMHELHGGDVSKLSLRHYDKPPLLPISELQILLA